MFLPGQPSEDFIRDYLARQAEQPFRINLSAVRWTVHCQETAGPSIDTAFYSAAASKFSAAARRLRAGECSPASWQRFIGQCRLAKERRSPCCIDRRRSGYGCSWRCAYSRSDRMQDGEGRTIQQFGFAYGTSPPIIRSGVKSGLSSSGTTRARRQRLVRDSGRFAAATLAGPPRLSVHAL